ncbi:MAG: Crp/Fnr family transcriptional regulator [bacterium]|nr:Crp/Fnr family transcriptional regulator [bacterium]
MKELELTVLHREDESCVRRVPIFRGLSAHEQDDVASFAHPVRLSRGELLHVAGDDVAQLVVVHTGALKLVHASASGRERLLRVAGPGEVVGEHSFLTGGAPDYYAEAAEETRLCVFAHADLARLVAEFPAIGVEMLRSLSNRLVESERLLALEKADVGARLAAYLLRLPDAASRTGRTVRLPLAKKDIASYLGTTPESLSRALARMQNAGIVSVEGERVTVLREDALEALGEGA